MSEDLPLPLSAMRRFLRLVALAVCRVCKLLLLLVLGYLGVVVVGLIPVNNGFAPPDDGVEIFVISNPIHADIIVPLRTEQIDWRTRFPSHYFVDDVDWATHAAIGWGDRAFFVDTPTWKEFRTTTAAHALFWPSKTCMHVSLVRVEGLRDRARSVRISDAQYANLVRYIEGSFVRSPHNDYLPISGAHYASNDAFFEARGVYHCFNTCNCWAGRGLQAAGVRIGWFTPLPKTVFLYWR